MRKIVLVVTFCFLVLENMAQEKNYLSHSFAPGVVICVNSEFNRETIPNFENSLLKMGWAGEKSKENEGLVRVFHPANGENYIKINNSKLISNDLKEVELLLYKKGNKLHRNRVSKKVERRVDKRYLTNYRADVLNQLKNKKIGHEYFKALLDVREDGAFNQDAMLKTIDDNTSLEEKKAVDARTEFRKNSKMSLREFFLSQNFVIVITPVNESYYRTKSLGVVTDHDASLIIVDVYQIPISDLDFQKITTQRQVNSPDKINLDYLSNYNFPIIHRDHFVCLNENILSNSYNSYQFNLEEMYKKMKKYIPNFQLTRTVLNDAPIIAELGVSNGITPNRTFEVIEPKEGGKFNHLGYVTSVRALKGTSNFKFKKSSFFNCEKYQILKLEARNTHVQMGVSIPSILLPNFAIREVPDNFQYYNIFAEIVGYKYGRSHRISFCNNPKFQIEYTDKSDKLLCFSMGLAYNKFFTYRIGSIGISLGPRFSWEGVIINNIERDGQLLFSTDLDSLGNLPNEQFFDQSEEVNSFSGNSFFIGVETMLSYNLSQSLSLFANGFYSYPISYLSSGPLSRDGLDYKSNINFKTPLGLNFGLKWFPQLNYKRYS